MAAQPRWRAPPRPARSARVQLISGGLAALGTVSIPLSALLGQLLEVREVGKAANGRNQRGKYTKHTVTRLQDRPSNLQGMPCCPQPPRAAPSRHLSDTPPDPDSPVHPIRPAHASHQDPPASPSPPPPLAVYVPPTCQAVFLPLPTDHILHADGDGSAFFPLAPTA